MQGEQLIEVMTNYSQICHLSIHNSQTILDH